MTNVPAATALGHALKFSVGSTILWSASVLVSEVDLPQLSVQGEEMIVPHFQPVSCMSTLSPRWLTTS